MNGIKHGKEKVKMELLSPIAIRELAAVLTYGAQKYEPRNWEKGGPWEKYVGASLRHIFAWMEGETNDPESGLNHLAHAMACLQFLLEFATTHPELDYRIKKSGNG